MQKVLGERLDVVHRQCRDESNHGSTNESVFVVFEAKDKFSGVDVRVFHELQREIRRR
jgi:hypothetical protein